MVLVEHVFVTTADSAPFLAACRALLAREGFAVDAPAATIVTATHPMNGLLPPAMRRTERASVRVDFDRGRVSVAVLLSDHRQLTPLHERWLIVVAASIERALGPDLEAAVADWQTAERRLREQMRKRRRTHRLTAAVIVILVFGLVAVFVIAKSRGH